MSASLIICLIVLLISSIFTVASAAAKQDKGVLTGLVIGVIVFLVGVGVIMGEA